MIANVRCIPLVYTNYKRDLSSKVYEMRSKMTIEQRRRKQPSEELRRQDL